MVLLKIDTWPFSLSHVDGDLFNALSLREKHVREEHTQLNVPSSNRVPMYPNF